MGPNAKLRAPVIFCWTSIHSFIDDTGSGVLYWFVCGFLRETQDFVVNKAADVLEKRKNTFLSLPTFSWPADLLSQVTLAVFVLFW